jgi:rare lipoprotein A
MLPSCYTDLESKRLSTTSTLEKDIMQTTKLVFMVMISLAIIDFSTAQSLNAATSAKAPKRSFTSTKHAASPASRPRKSKDSMHGLAAVYSDQLNGRKTASGQRFCQDGLTAAHRSLPLGTKVRVTNIRSGKSVVVSINDRGPRHARLVIDLSAAAAAKIGMQKTGTALVKLEIVSEVSARES